jgi:hypothetical protein
MAQKRRIPRVTIENAQIRFRNFSGKEGQFNAKGERNFAVLLDKELATRMIEDGWNVKQLKPRDEGDEPQDYVQVKVSWANVAPRVVLVTSKGRTNLGEDDVNILDFAEIKNVDLIIHPSSWVIPARGNQEEKSGVKAYLHTLFVTIEESVLDLKYADVPDSAVNVIGANEDFSGFED